ncbi:winged helix-turn-helix domain-containing protein [Limnoglobus roseus]|uniref:Helix-turn-helix domain-containing protein n=1 Tax=Limnoglobus roseus TaxID=2598579 RepID=A0A5C1AGV2_9BACT|nr:winged helix-turn-helix domain-containing protein [Limnoglobus roseus]QEL17473.1 helix-turn-helix domain-containing protein [Limnoglobus roseus]
MSTMEPARTAADKEARRLAVDKVAARRSQQDVADFLSIHPVTVNTWVRAYCAAGADRPAGTPHPGRMPFLTPSQEKKILAWLNEKPTRHGFPTDLWTACRAAELIRRKFGVAYYPNYLRKWMTRRNLTPQKPAKRARERTPAVIDRGRTEAWPAVQKTADKLAHVVWIDASGLFLKPSFAGLGLRRGGCRSSTPGVGNWTR